MDSSLDDYIGQKGGGRGNRKGGGRARRNNGGNNGGRRNGGRASRGGGPGPAPYNPLSRTEEEPDSYKPVRSSRGNRWTPYDNDRKPRRSADSEGAWKRDMYDNDDDARSSRPAKRRPAPRSKPARTFQSRNGGKSAVVDIFNLSSQVEDEDLEDIFAEIGDILKTNIETDDNGDPNGCASVTFRTRAQAQEAVEEFDRAKVDGRPMTVSLAEPEEAPRPSVVVEKKPRVQKAQPNRRRNNITATTTSNNNRTNNQQRRNNRNGRQQAETKAALFGSAMDTDDDNFFRARNNNRRNNNRGGGRGKGGGRGGGRGRKGGRGGRGGRGGKKPEKKDVSKDDLDAEMDAYQLARATE